MLHLKILPCFLGLPKNSNVLYLGDLRDEVAGSDRYLLKILIAAGKF